MSKINAAITCVHGVVPEKILSNKDLEKMVPYILEKYTFNLNQLNFVNNYA